MCFDGGAVVVVGIFVIGVVVGFFVFGVVVVVLLGLWVLFLWFYCFSC